MSQGRSIISNLMMVWMLLLAGFLSYRQINQNATKSPAPSSSGQTVWLR
jgi:hypothetical protein